MDQLSRRRCRSLAAHIPAILLLLLFLGAPVSRAGDGALQVHFIDVGQGDSAWLNLPSGDDVLIDGGKRQAGSTVVAYLQGHGVADIELLVATHGDSDHIGGLLDVLDSMPVTEAWLDSQNCTTSTCTEFYQSLASHGVITALVRMGEIYPWGDVTARVLNPSEPLYADKNENSVVLWISYGSVEFLLTGDVETGAEGRMLASGLPLEAEILKVAHHGSNSSSSANFLATVAPREAVISVGPNPYGHPRAEVLDRLQDAGAGVWRTDHDGTVIVTTQGVSYTIAGMSVTPTSTATVLINVFLPLILRSATGLPGSPTPTFSPSPSASATLTETPLPTATPTGTPMASATPTASRTPTHTPSPSHTPTFTLTPSPTATPTESFTPTPTATTAPADVNVAAWCSQFDAPGNDHDNLNEEYVCFENDGGLPADMTGWYVKDEADHTYSFPSFTLDAGAIVRLRTGSGTNTATNLYWGRGQAVWNNTGDTVYLYDGSWMLLDSYSY